jgi:hypothetical protein
MDFVKLLLAHNGALGDFLTVWPALWAVRRAFPKTPAHWVGRGERGPWLQGLDLTPPPPALRAGVERLYGASRWPESLDDALVVWFYLDRKPVELEHERLWLIPTLDAAGAPPSLVARRGLERRGVVWDEDWLAVWRARCGAWDARTADAKRVLLFPGAGHRLKQWPLKRFVALAERLAQRGFTPVLVLGPAEQERGLDPGVSASWRVERCESMTRLTELLLGAAAVLGCDSGPLHLAGYLGTPCLALFGPTSERQWAPPNARVVSLSLDCRPCTASTRDLTCAWPRCLEEIPVDRVEAELLELLETGQDAGGSKSKPAHETAP